ncbi:MAG TPA: hypothetical protein VLS49_11940 [Usitatibacter sp.]|nr:hypothetical protein [Usitatibacter sp.]
MAASELRRAARALVATRTERFESLHDPQASRERLRAALERSGARRVLAFHGEWKTEDGKAAYEASFAPSPRVAFLLQALSIGLALLIAATAWLFYSGEGSRALRFLVPMSTLLTFVALPLVVQAMSSQREAEEARILRAIRVALQGESERYPAQQRWADEE